MLKQDYVRDGAAIYERSFAIIRAEADLSRFTPAQAEAALRAAHCKLMFDIRPQYPAVAARDAQGT